MSIMRLNLKEVPGKVPPRGTRIISGIPVGMRLHNAERTMESIISFIEKRLFLKVNRDKTKVACIRNIKFLGYSFYRYNGECRLRVHPKSVEKMRARIGELTSRSNGWVNERRKIALNQYIKDWVQYFKLADIKTLLITTDAWLRRRLRMVIWKQWKRISTKWANLVKQGINRYKAYEWAYTRKGRLPLF